MEKDIKATTNKDGNLRSKSVHEIHSEETAAWAEINKVLPESQVSIPSIENIINAKEWVDDGSKL